jgi:hypothetical protein
MASGPEGPQLNVSRLIPKLGDGPQSASINAQLQRLLLGTTPAPKL